MLTQAPTLQFCAVSVLYAQLGGENNGLPLPIVKRSASAMYLVLLNTRSL